MREKGQRSSSLLDKTGASAKVKGLLTKILKLNKTKPRLELFIITREKAVFMSGEVHVPGSGWGWSWENMGVLFWVLLVFHLDKKQGHQLRMRMGTEGGIRGLRREEKV